LTVGVVDLADPFGLTSTAGIRICLRAEPLALEMVDEQEEVSFPTEVLSRTPSNRG
jgi:hypothetical protein